MKYLPTAYQLMEEGSLEDFTIWKWKYYKINIQVECLSKKKKTIFKEKHLVLFHIIH